MRFNEFLNYLSESMSNQVICVSNKGNARVLSGDWSTGKNRNANKRKGRAYSTKSE